MQLVWGPHTQYCHITFHLAKIIIGEILYHIVLLGSFDISMQNLEFFIFVFFVWVSDRNIDVVLASVFLLNRGYMW